MPTMKAGDRRLELRLSPDLYEALTQAAQRQERSLNRMATLILRQALQPQPEHNRPPAARRPGRGRRD